MNIIESRRTTEDTCEAISYDIILDGATIGWASVIEGEDSPAYIERIDIEEAYRNQGHGTVALGMLSDLFGGVYIAPDNDDARRLYARIGKMVSGIYYDEDQDEEILMNSGDYADCMDQGYGVYRI